LADRLKDGLDKLDHPKSWTTNGLDKLDSLMCSTSRDVSTNAQGAFRNRKRTTTVARNSSHQGSGVADLVQSVVVDSEVVGHLVPNGDPHLLDHFGLVLAQLKDRVAEYDDPIR